MQKKPIGHLAVLSLQPLLLFLGRSDQPPSLPPAQFQPSHAYLCSTYLIGYFQALTGFLILLILLYPGRSVFFTSLTQQYSRGPICRTNIFQGSNLPGPNLPRTQNRNGLGHFLQKIYIYLWRSDIGPDAWNMDLEARRSDPGPVGRSFCHQRIFDSFCVSEISPSQLL